MTKSNRPALIVFGKHAHKAPRAAWFTAADIGIARWIGERYAMSLLKVDGNFMRSLSNPIEEWELGQNGPPVMPTIRLEVYEQLKARAADAENLVATDAAGEPTVAAANGASGAATTQRREAANVMWGALTTGSLVLAIEDPPAEGWWEAIILSRRNGTCIVYYRDHPHQGLIKRDMHQLAVMHPVM